jgi:predicted nucleic acid-binding protein
VSAVAYLDSSALVKLLQHETESEALVAYLDRPVHAVCSSLCIPEVVRAVQRAGWPIEEARSLVEALVLVELSPLLLWRAAELQPAGLRTLDAIHVASALMVDDPAPDFVTYDTRLADVARTHGLRVVHPGR